MITGRLGYSPKTQRYGLLVADLWRTYKHEFRARYKKQGEASCAIGKSHTRR